MSPLVTRPSLPEPGTVAASTPLSAESFRTDGASGASAAAAFGAAAGGAAGAAAGAASAAFAGAAAGLAAAAPSLICPSNAPTATVSPSLATISPSVPADGAGTSMVTLSVSSSTSGSSTATASPAFLNQRPMVASVTDSPSVGTRISVMVFPLSRHGQARPGHPRLNPQLGREDVDARDKRPGMTASEKPSVQRLIQKRLELRQMLRHQSGGGGRRRRAAGVARTLIRSVDLVQHPFQIGLDEVPRAHIARLFLAPHQFGAPEAAELGYQRLQRHRIELLDAHDIDVVDAALLALLIEVVIDLARTQNDAPDLVVRDELDLLVRQHLGIIVKQAMERGVGAHLVEPRYCALVAQQRLRRHHDQRLADLALQLPPQHVEQIGRRGGVDHLHVVFRAHLQEALQPRRGMLGPLSLIAMRQHADEAGHAQPFAFPRGDELVEQHLRAIGEVAELRFPDGQRGRLGQRVAVLEAEHRFFRQQRVDDLVTPLIGLQMLERGVAGLVFL